VLTKEYQVIDLFVPTNKNLVLFGKCFSKIILAEECSESFGKFFFANCFFFLLFFLSRLLLFLLLLSGSCRGCWNCSYWCC